MSSKKYTTLANQDDDDEESGSEPPETPRRRCCDHVHIWWTSLKAFVQGYTNAPKAALFQSQGNFKCAWWIWLVLVVVFFITACLQIDHWLKLGSFPPIVTTSVLNRFFFAPNIEICNEIPVEGEGIQIEKLETYEATSDTRTSLLKGQDYFPVPDCAKAAIWCDEDPPVQCPIPDLYWPIDPGTGKRVTTGHALSPLTDCSYNKKPCTRLFLKPGGKAKLFKSEALDKSTALHVTAYREVNPEQWLLRSKLMPGRCLVSTGTRVQLGSDVCSNYIINNDMSAMFQFYAQKGETGVIQVRGGNCVEADYPQRPYATLAPCDFAGTVLFDPARGFITVSGGGTTMCLSSGEARADEMIKIVWGTEVVTGFKVFWSECADRTNDPKAFAKQTWMLDAATGLLTSSITLPQHIPEPYCLMMSDNPLHWSKETLLLTLLPCSFVKPTAQAATQFWTKADAALAKGGSAPVMVEVDAAQATYKQKSHMFSKTTVDTCTVSTHVLTGHKLGGTAEWTCKSASTSCHKDCGICAPGCDYVNWIGDGNCNPQCNNAACNFDCSDKVCDCFSQGAGETTQANAKQRTNYNQKVLGAFNNCTESCGKFIKPRTSLLRFRWELGKKTKAGIPVSLLDSRPNQGCKLPGQTGETQGGVEYHGMPCYKDTFDRLNAGGVAFTGTSATWCLVGQKYGAWPNTLANIDKNPLPAKYKPAKVGPCHGQLNAQRFRYDASTGLIKAKGGGCLKLDSEIICTNIRTLGTPMKALASIPMVGTFPDLKTCSAAVKAALFELFKFRSATGATFDPATKICSANMGHVETDEFVPGIDYCHFGIVESNSVFSNNIVVGNCVGSDPRQQFQVTPQTFFAPHVAFSPPQTRPVTPRYLIWLRVLYEKCQLKMVVDQIVTALWKAGWTSLKTRGLWGQLPPIDLVLPGSQHWDKAGHTRTSRNQLYRITLNPEGYGKRYLSSLDMAWSMTGEDMRMAVQTSDIVLEKDPIESLRTERIYMHIAYGSEQIAHHIATADMMTAFSTMIAVLLASAGLLSCWQHAFPLDDTHHIAIQSASLKMLQVELAKAGVTPDDLDDLGIDISSSDERVACCPWFCADPAPHEE